MRNLLVVIGLIAVIVTLVVLGHGAFHDGMNSFMNDITQAVTGAK